MRTLHIQNISRQIEHARNGKGVYKVGVQRGTRIKYTLRKINKTCEMKPEVHTLIICLGHR